MKIISSFFKKGSRNKTDKKEISKNSPALNRAEMKTKATKGAEKAVREYRWVFDQLAEYDRS